MTNSSTAKERREALVNIDNGTTPTINGLTSNSRERLEEGTASELLLERYEIIRVLITI